ncbi:DUF2628 domain-containing protein [Budviciaceae bacterium BWR-B9]|uniref:DUF2628 domain-containing protein n=1 Tax=Limnobaculum allomyrinae TaxID=2791986 RepID=A0ABS1IPQ9_9GAMM|nr:MULTISPECIES: DUF2628 domain-containing protein [Limnobaculum]MBK5143748.1 DUF2628 domain-containing protein [Limnobaculum allomyrinae]MBV7693487.1 DUF2628 domain-containing protein [Limnobaculum sp. M2-1]
MDKSKYSERWQTRFAFFDQYGAPNTPEHKAAIQAKKPTSRILFRMNFIAFFFGFIYFFILGLWKKNLVLFGIAIGIAVIITVIETVTGFYLPQGANIGINVACAMMWSITANYAYYLKEVKGSDSWNPFEGI